MRMYNLLSILLVLCFFPVFGGDAKEIVFATFDKDGDAEMWSGGDSGGVKVTADNRDKTDLNKSLRVETVSGQYPGINTYKMPKDWSSFEVFSFEVWSTASYGLGIRIDDDNSKNFATRFNSGATLEKGRNLIQVPIKELDKTLDMSKIKAVILFTVDSPKGFTLHFDNFRLGPRLTDKVDFIPYKDRIELVPSVAIESAHYPLCKPTAGGPLNALVIYGMEEGRDLTELMERIDLKVSPVSWGRDPGVHKWIGLKYGDRSYELSQRYLASSAQGPEKFDTMILATPTGWIPLGKGGTDAIIDRVKNRGEGLVLSFPFPGVAANQAWPDDLKEISALIDSETDFLRDSGWIKIANNGHSIGKKWKVVKEHPITQGLQAVLDSLPYEALNVQQYKLAPGAEVLIETEDGFPVVAVKTVGKGRVVTIAARSESLAPLVKDAGNKRQWRDYRYWEAFYDLMARSALWTANREMKRDGDGVPLANPKYPDAALPLRQWKNAKGEITAWELGFTPPAYKPITVTTPEFIKRGETQMEVKMVLPSGTPSKVQIVVRLVDYAGNRHRTMVEKLMTDDDLENGTIKEVGKETFVTTVPTAKLESLAVFVEVEVLKDGKRLSYGETTTYITPSAEWTDYEVYGWGNGGVSYVDELRLARLREFGLTTEQVDGNTARKSFQRGFRIHSMMSATGMHADGFDEKYREFSRTGNKELLIRKPSFADKAFLQTQKQAKQTWLKGLIPFSPLTVSMGDETSLTSYTAVFDFDFHPDNIANFRAKLQKKFGTIDALNAALGEKWASFDTVEPPITPTDAKARATGNFGLWNEWRDHNDDMWSGAFQYYADFLKEIYPDTRLSVSGTQTSSVFNGVDWAKLSPAMGAIADYTGRYQLCQRLSFNPRIRSTPWAGYGREGRGADYQLWSNLTFEGDGTAFFWYPSLLNPDFEFSESAKAYNRALKVICSGVGKQYLQTRRQFSPVAVLWSVRSQRAAWLQDKDGEFQKAEKQVYDGLVDAGYDPFFISDAQVAAGELKAKGVRALALPMTLSLGMGGKGGQDELAAIKTFHAEGGLVLNTHAVVQNEFLQPATVPAEVAGKFVAFPAGADALQKVLSDAKIQPYAHVRTAEGKRSPNVTASLHALVDAKGNRTAGQILTVLRSPVGQKELIGADGVVYMQNDPAGGAPVETLVIDLPGATGMFLFDIRNRKPLVMKDGKVTIEMQEGDGRPIAILPYGTVTLNAGVKRSAEALAITLGLQAGGKPVSVPHVVRMDVKDLSTGLMDGLLSKNLLAGPDGTLTAEVGLAREDATRKLEVTFTDILTGATQTVAP